MIKIIRISGRPLFVVVSRFNGDDIYYHYWMDKIVHINPTDVGRWRIKYKE